MLRKHEKAFATFPFGYIEVLLFDPPKECDSLRKNSISLKVICGYRSVWYGEDDLGREGAMINLSGVLTGDAVEKEETHKSYKRFMTSFSMPSMALSNSVSDASLHTSVSRIRSEMN